MMRLLQKLGIRFNRLFFRMLLYFLTLLIPVIIIGAITYNYSANSMRADYTKAIRMNLQSSAKTIDIYLKTAQETSVNFLYDETAHRLLQPQNKMTPENKSELNSISKVIARNQNIVSEYIDNVFVYLDDKTVYTSDGMDSFDSFFNKFYRLDKYSAGFWTKMLQSEKSIQILPPSRVESDYRNTVKSVVPIITVRKVNGYNTAIVINILTDMVYKAIKRNSTFKDTSFIVLDGNDVVIYADENLGDGDIDKIAWYYNNTPKQAGNIEISEHEYITTYIKSDNFGWKYYSLTSVQELNRHAMGVLRMTVFSCIALILIGIALSFVFSIKIYNPIKNIRDILAERKEIFTTEGNADTSRDEWEYIGNGIHRLVDNTMNYANKVQKLSNEYFDNSFLHLICGHSLDHENMFAKTLREELGFKNDLYLCCNIAFHFKAEYYTEFQDTDRLSMSEGLKKVFWALLDEYVKAYMIEYKQNQYVCIVNMEDESEKALLMKALNNIIQCFDYDFRYSEMVIGIGKIYTNLKDIWKSYNDALSAIDSRQSGDDFQIIDARNIAVKHSILYSLTDETRIINCLKTGDAENMKRNVEELIQQNKQNSVSYKYMDMLFMELYNTGVKFVAEKGIEIEQLISEEEQDYISRTDNYDTDRKLALLLEFFNRIIDHTMDRSKNKSGSLVSMIIQYIEENYHKDIYLEKIAEDMGVSFKYISRIFKQKTGINLTDYVSMIRIKKAKELLINTKMNIEDISQSVGIYSRTTFIRLFKKFEGTNPSSFREYSEKNLDAEYNGEGEKL